jgi:hypothetical protein
MVNIANLEGRANGATTRVVSRRGEDIRGKMKRWCALAAQGQILQIVGLIWTYG